MLHNPIILGDDLGTTISITFSSDSQLIAKLGPTLSLWNVTSQDFITNLVETQFGYVTVESIAFSPDSKLLVGGSPSGWIAIWDVVNGEQLFTLLCQNDPVCCIAFNADGTILVSGHAYRTVRLWDVPTWTQLDILDASSHNDVVSVAFSPNGETLATGSEDTACLCILPDAAIIWDVSKKVKKATFTAPFGTSIKTLLYTPDSTKLLGLLVDPNEESKIKLWDITTEEELEISINPASNICAIALHPDGTTLAVGMEDGSVLLWDITTNIRIGIYNNHSESLAAIAFSPDGHYLATGSIDGRFTLWNVQ